VAPSTTINPIWRKGRTCWPSNPTALLRYTPESGGFSIASNQPDIDQTVEGLSQALSQLPAYGEQNQERQRLSGMGDGSYLQKKDAITQIRKMFADSEIQLVEAIDRADWGVLKKDPQTSVHYPAWHPANSAVYNHRSSVPPERRLQRSQPLDNSMLTPTSSEASRTAGRDQVSALGKRGPDEDFKTSDSKRQATSGPGWTGVGSMEAQKQGSEGDTEMRDA
jgi:hypothetical protein